MSIIQPKSAQELADALGSAAANGQSIRLGGAFTKDCMGGPLAEAGVTISTAALTRVLEYEPNDLTVSVEAGMLFADLNRLLHPHRQMVPLDPPWGSSSTVGGVVAANLSGPRRRLYGTARDMVIGMKFATLEGKLVQSGGMVVKNVAGLDMAKLMIGSFGTLAAVVSVNFRLNVLPAAARTFVLRFPDIRSAIARRNSILGSVLQPAAIDLLNPPVASLFGEQGFVLLVRAGGEEALLARYAQELPDAESLDGEVETALWERVQEFVPGFLHANPRGVVLRLSRAINAISDVAGSTGVPVLARAGAGVCYACFDHYEQAQASGWRGLIEYGPPELKSKMTLWPAPGTDFPVMEQIKRMFDPNHLLNRGRLHGRI
jgi:glycolate oxidase FAD binding subunit